VLIGEDDNFPNHHGIDYRALRVALGYPRRGFEWGSSSDRNDLLATLPELWSRRSALRGASTITQQLAKNLYLSASRNPLRKIKEAVTAYRLESALDKDRILELYLNVVELGDGVWGVEAASQKYFGQPARTLSAEQAAALAGTLPFPLSSNPRYRPGRMRWRQNLILRRMRGEELDVPHQEEEDQPRSPEAATADPEPADSSFTAPDTTIDTSSTPADSASAAQVLIPADSGESATP
jgi:monofunctional biosynthetic peptidoglycan transglycosylase